MHFVLQKKITQCCEATILQLKKEHILYDVTYMWDLKKIIQMTVHKKTDSDIENKLVVTTGERGGKKGKLGVWD